MQIDFVDGAGPDMCSVEPVKTLGNGWIMEVIENYWTSSRLTREVTQCRTRDWLLRLMMAEARGRSQIKMQ